MNQVYSSVAVCSKRRRKSIHSIYVHVNINLLCVVWDRRLKMLSEAHRKFDDRSEIVTDDNFVKTNRKAQWKTPDLNDPVNLRPRSSPNLCDTMGIALQ